MVKSTNPDTDLGAFAQDVSRYPVWDAEMEREMGRRLVAARKARDDKAVRRIEDLFCRHNLRLVLSIAQRARANPVPFCELVQEGNMGLAKAVEKFKPEKGNRFSTYATWWIRQAIGRAVDNAGFVRIPVHLAETHRKIKRVRGGFATDMGRDPTEKELAKLTRLPIKKIRIADAALSPISSLDAIDDFGNAAIDTQAGPDESPIDTITTSERATLAKRLLDSLPPRQRDVISSRFGLKEPTLEEVGKRLNLTRERIRQIEKVAISKLQRAAGVKTDK